METNEIADNADVLDDRQFLISVESTLNPTMNNLRKLVDNAEPDCAKNGELQDIGMNNSRERDLLQSVLKSSATWQKNEAERILALERKCKEQQVYVQRQTDDLEKAREEIRCLKNQISNQSNFCAILGATLGHLTWHSSSFPEIIDVWLSGFQNKIEEFLSIVNGSFVAFINTYGTAFPPVSNVEYQFVIGLLGIVTNISSSPEGRQFLITNANGKDFVRNVATLMPGIPSSAGSVFLKRLLLMILYNVSVNKTGLQYLFELRVGKVLSYCLEEDSLPEELQLLCLRVLQSITYKLAEPKYIRDLMTSISFEKIESIISSSNGRLRAVAKGVMKHLRESKKFLEST